MMSRKFFLIIALVSVSLTMFGQKNVEQLFSEFSKVSDATKVTMGKTMMGFASLFTNTMGVNSIEVLSLDECNQETKEQFSEAIKNLKDPDYETMVTSNEKGQRTKVLVKIEDELIREMVVVVTGKNAALVRLKGKISPSDIEKLANEHSKNG